MGEEKDAQQGASAVIGSGQTEDQINFVKEALKWQYNWIGLAGAVAFALASGSGLPLVLAAGFELIYLSLVPHNKQFQRLVRSWKYAEEKRRHELQLSAMFHQLPPGMRTRYADLDSLCRAISANYSELSSTSQIFLRQMEDRLQGLLQSYLRLLHAAYRHREYLRVTDPDVIKRDVAELQRRLGSDAPKVQEINSKRIEILTKRLERFNKIRENCQVIDAQCAAIEDVLKLIGDQSVTMRDPQEVSDRLENLVRDVEQTEETVRQVEAIFDLAAPDPGATLGPLATSQPAFTSGPGRTRVRN